MELEKNRELIIYLIIKLGSVISLRAARIKKGESQYKNPRKETPTPLMSLKFDSNIEIQHNLMHCISFNSSTNNKQVHLYSVPRKLKQTNQIHNPLEAKDLKDG